MRLLTAIGIAAVALATAIYLHHRTYWEPCGLGIDRPVCVVHSSWQDPVAVVIAVVGLALAGAIVTRHFAHRT